MPSKNAPCPCPSCDGRIRSAKTLRAHAALQIQIAADQANWRREYERAIQEDAADDTESDEDSEISDGDSQHAAALERPSKRVRVDNEGELNAALVCLIFGTLNQFHAFMYLYI